MFGLDWCVWDNRKNYIISIIDYNHINICLGKFAE